MEIKKVSIIGAGTMGNGIAQVFAQNNYEVTLIDLNEEALKKALASIDRNLDRMIKKEKITAEGKTKALACISTSLSIEGAVENSDLVIEAATENPVIKKKIFTQIDALTSDRCILATNTSSISITQIAAVTQHPENVIGMHFMNPVPIMKLIEVIRGYSTSDEVCLAIHKLSKNIGKVPIEVNDYPGFIANRILLPMLNEAIFTLYQGIAGVEEIDSIMKLGMGHPMGPLQLADFIGLDVCLYILKVMQEGFGEVKFAPCPLLVNMVNAGKLGVKSGEGFYKYEANSKNKTVAPKFL